MDYAPTRPRITAPWAESFQAQLLSTTGDESGVAVAGVARVELIWKPITDVLWELAPGLGPTWLEFRVARVEKTLGILP